MSSIEEVVDSFKDRALEDPSGELYLQLPDAFDFLTACQEHNIAILGIDGALYDGKYIDCPLDMILDSSGPLHPSEPPISTWQEFKEYCGRKAFEFLQQLTPRDDLWLIITVCSEDVWDDSRSRMKLQ